MRTDDRTEAGLLRVRARRALLSRCSFSIALSWFSPTESLLLPGVQARIVLPTFGLTARKTSEGWARRPCHFA